jgi:effector-binding domain-containing protein
VRGGPRSGREDRERVVRPGVDEQVLVGQAVERAVATHVGEHDDIDVTYGELGAWVVANALAVAGPVRETYRVGPRDAPDPAAWRTEIDWLVFRMAPR